MSSAQELFLEALDALDTGGYNFALKGLTANLDNGDIIKLEPFGWGLRGGIAHFKIKNVNWNQNYKYPNQAVGVYKTIRSLITLVLEECNVANLHPISWHPNDFNSVMIVFSHMWFVIEYGDQNLFTGQLCKRVRGSVWNTLLTPKPIPLEELLGKVRVALCQEFHILYRLATEPFKTMKSQLGIQTTQDVMNPFKLNSS